MKSFVNYSTKLVLLLLLYFSAIAASAQDGAKLRLDRLNRLEDKAADVVEVNIDGKLLELAKRVLQKVNDKDARKVGEAIAGLRGIYVKVFNFEKENDYAPADIDDIRLQLQTPAWEKMVNVRSKKDNQKVDVFTMFTGDKISGLAVVVSDSKSIAVVNVVGPLDIEMIVELSGHLNIPKIDIEEDKKDKQEKPKN